MSCIEFLFELLLVSGSPFDGDGLIMGDDGADILGGGGGNDVVCGDEDDIMLVGGPGTDIPCPVFTGVLDATSGPVSGDLSAGIRDLDDEFDEVNPYEFVVTKAPTKGTVVFDPLTGEFTYTPDPGQTGLDDFEYTLRRVITDPEANGAVEPGTNDDGFIYSITQIVEFFLGDPPPAVQPRAIAQVAPPTPTQTTGAQLPATGVETTGLALIGLGLLMLGGLAFCESQRRETAVMRNQARHLARN